MYFFVSNFPKNQTEWRMGWVGGGRNDEIFSWITLRTDKLTRIMKSINF